MTKKSEMDVSKIRCPEIDRDAIVLVRWHIEDGEVVVDSVICDNPKLEDLDNWDCEWTCWDSVAERIIPGKETAPASPPRKKKPEKKLARKKSAKRKTAKKKISKKKSAKKKGIKKKTAKKKAVPKKKSVKKGAKKKKGSRKKKKR